LLPHLREPATAYAEATVPRAESAELQRPDPC